MPFIRYARDKRGYESTFVMHAPRPGQGPQRARVLYLFRTPAHVKIGRRALEPEVMEALEHTHPDLTFDWTNIPSERPAEPADGREREGRRDWAHRQGPRGAARPGRPGPPSGPAPLRAPAPPPVIEDESPLGRVVGPERAARLRARYAELTERVTRRSRTPEDRDRLLERLQRLNPDEWGDEAAVRAAVFTVETEWNALSAELPSRRRGRRGGRHRREAGGPGGSGIIEGTPHTESTEAEDELVEAAAEPLDLQDGRHAEDEFAVDDDDPGAAGGGHGRLGAESSDDGSAHTAEPEHAADPEAWPGGDAEPAEPGVADLQGDD